MRALARRRRFVFLATFVTFALSIAILAVDPQRGQPHGGLWLALWLVAVAGTGSCAIWRYRQLSSRLEAATVVDADGRVVASAGAVGRQLVHRKIEPLAVGVVSAQLVTCAAQVIDGGAEVPPAAVLAAIVVGVLAWRASRSAQRREAPGPLPDLRWREIA